jgi:hypothetical protein
MEKLGAGFRLIRVGKRETPGGVWPPHAGKETNKEMVTTIHTH